MTTRCTHCGATLTWYAGQQWQVCWTCARVTQRVTKAEADPERPASHPSAVAVGDVPNSLPRVAKLSPPLTYTVSLDYVSWLIDDDSESEGATGDA